MFYFLFNILIRFEFHFNQKKLFNKIHEYTTLNTFTQYTSFAIHLISVYTYKVKFFHTSIGVCTGTTDGIKQKIVSNGWVT